MNNLRIDSRLKANLPIVIVSCISFISLTFSVFESRFNQDSHHWGLMYSIAVDVLNGLQPYIDSLNPYGILAAPINIIGLNIFGDRIVSLGIIYGILYSASLIIIYFLLGQFLDRWLSVVSVLLIFLIHGHIIAPWPNYAYYIFLLLSLLVFTRSQQPAAYFGTGLLLACSLLTRNTSFIAILPPIFIYFLTLYISDRKLITIKNIGLFTLGLILPLAIFLLYLINTASVQSWSFQTFQLFSVRFFSIEFQSQDTALMKYPLFIYVLGKNIVRGLLFGDLRLKLYSLAFFNNLVILVVTLVKFKRRKFVDRQDSSLLLFCLVSTFGYLTALHDYQIFRLQSSAALSIGILIYSLSRLAQLGSNPRVRLLLLFVPCSFVVINLVSNFQFVPQSSYFEPWNLNSILAGDLREPKVGILQGKLYKEQRASYYEEISQILDKYADRLKILVNLTEDSFIPSISNKYKRVQVAPFFALSTAASFRAAEQARYTPSLNNGQAILFGYDGYKFEQFYGNNASGSTTEIPDNYQILKSIANPDGNGKLIVAIPKKSAAGGS
jgi:hypothetical protein